MLIGGSRPSPYCTSAIQVKAMPWRHYIRWLSQAFQCTSLKLKKVGPDSHEWLIAQDMDKEKRKREAVDEWDGQPRITFVFSTNSKLNPAFLGPSLKRRFLDDS